MSERVVHPVVSLPDESLAGMMRVAHPDADYLVWDMRGPAPRPDIDLVVVPYQTGPNQTGPTRALPLLAGTRTRLVQYPAAGYDGVAEVLPPGVVLANAASVHETSTSELALALILASLRAIPGFVRAQDRQEWHPLRTPSLADRTVLIVGYGNVAKAVEARLVPFEVEILRVATTPRHEDGRHVHGMDELPGLLPQADIVVLIVPLTARTRHLADAAFLAGMRDGALLVNVARGPVVDTDALIAELRSGRISAALDVTDPEPLPPDHPLWTTPNLLISPHVGGATTAMMPRLVSLVARQIGHLARGEEPENVVIRS